jgi:Fe2+ or Zn2+ uptake regulation protein
MDKQKRNTKTKEMVMTLFSNASSALCYDDLEQQLAGQLNRVTIYRILQSFCDDGKVHKIPDKNGKVYYALCQDCEAGHHNDNHVHFRCMKCENIICIDKPVDIPGLPRGYRVRDVSCFISGYCPNCSSSTHEKTVAGRAVHAVARGRRLRATR